MAGVLRDLRWPVLGRRKAELWEGGMDLSAQELAAAKEILEEIFAVSAPDVDEMIRQRIAERGWV
jgi:hypothetical protein